MKFAYLGENSTLPIIVTASLTLDEAKRLLGIERESKTAFGRTIADIKGVSPSICMEEDQFIFPADLIILDMEEDQEIPIIHGRLFLATREL